MWFEDMKADFDTELAKLQKFLGTEVSEDKLEELKKRLDMQALALQKMRGEKGKVGGMKAALKEDHLVSEWKEWIKEKIQGTDLPIITIQ